METLCVDHIDISMTTGFASHYQTASLRATFHNMKNAAAVIKNKVGKMVFSGMSLDEAPDDLKMVAEGLGEFVDFVGSVPLGLLLVLPLWELVPTLNGADELAARFAKMTSRALSSCPNPLLPSYLAEVQSKPQVVLLSPPEQEAAAP